MTGAAVNEQPAPCAACRFCDTYRAAKGGDPNQMALLAQMLETGYGCQVDLQHAGFWQQLARERGARRIEGVYDRLP